MAVASKTWTAAYGSYVRLRITAQEVEVDVPNNRSKVRVTGQIYYNGGTSSSNAYSQTYAVAVNGSGIGNQTGITYSLSSGGTRNLTTYTSGWINHNSNGAKSVTVKGYITDGHGDTATIEQSYALTTIARASTFSRFSMPNALRWDTANTFSLSLARKNTDFRHDISLRDGSTTIASWTGQGAPTTLTLSATQVNTLLNRTGGSATRTMTLRVQTKSGSTNIGSVMTRTATASIHSSARASEFSSFSIPNHLRPGNSTALNLSLARRDTNFRHDIQLRDGSTVIASWTNQGAPTALALTATQTNTLLRRMSSSISRTLTLRVQTKSGSTNIGSALTRTATGYVHPDVKPIVEKLSVHPTGNAHAMDNVKRFVQNISHVWGTFERTATGGASISSAKLEIRRKSGGSDYQSIGGSSGTFSRPVAFSGQYQAKATATDSRGRSNTTDWVDLSNFDVLAYSVPQITEFSTERRASPETTVNITRNGKHSGLSGKNVLTIKLQKRASGTTSWTNVAPDVTTTNNTFELTVPSTGHSVASSYEFRLYVVDQFGNSAEQLSSVTTQRVVLDIHKNEGVGIGKIHERGDLDINGNMYLDGFFSIGNADSPTSEIRMVSSTPDFGNAGIELTSNKPDGKGTTYLDFNTTRNSSDSEGGDARISVTGGDPGVWRKGEMTIYAGKITQWADSIALSTGNLSLNNESIISRQNGSNGWSIRFYDGTQICFISNLNNSNNLSYKEGYLYRAGSVTWRFQRSFIEGGHVVVVASANTWEHWCSTFNTLTDRTSIIEWASTSGRSGTTIRAIAIGRWK